MADKFIYGPANPHPLSQRHTELVWDGKYDEYGQRREVNVAELSMPMQRIETVDEPRQRAEAQGRLDLFEKKRAKIDDFRNRLIWGDNKLKGSPSTAIVYNDCSTSFSRRLNYRNAY